jgi:hypothetical protein
VVVGSTCTYLGGLATPLLSLLVQLQLQRVPCAVGSSRLLILSAVLGRELRPPVHDGCGPRRPVLAGMLPGHLQNK